MALGHQKQSLFLLDSPHSFLLPKGAVDTAQWTAAKNNNMASVRALYSF